MQVDGSCLCGAVTYTAEVDPDRAAICHCHDCQVNAGTAFGLVVGVIDSQFTLLTGRLQGYDKVAESGRVRTLSFCPICATRIHARTEGDADAFIGLRLGTVTQRAQISPKVQAWCQSALPWVENLALIPRRDTQG